MDEQIFYAIISSSVLAAGITGIINWRINSNHNKREFFSRVLEKRLQSYEELNKLIAFLNTKIQVSGNLIVHHALSDYDYHILFLKQLSITQDHSIWMSQEIGSLLTQINAFMFSKISSKADSLERKDYNEYYIMKGDIHFDEIEDLKKTLQHLMVKEIENIYNIKKFIKEKKKDKTEQFPLEV